MRLLFMVLAMVPLSLYGQVPIIQWQKTYGGSGDDRLVSMRKTADGGYILGGHSTSGISGEKTEATRGDYDYWIIKIDQVGNIQWQKTYGGAHKDMLSSVIQTSDLGYFVTGYSESAATGDKTDGNRGTIGSASVGRDFWLLKLDQTGNLLWQKTYGTTAADMCFVGIQLPDGGYMTAGLTAGTGGERNTAINAAPVYGYNDHWMVRLDAQGNMLWQKSNGGNLHDQIYGMVRTPDGGYVAGGSSVSGPSGTKTTPFLGGVPNNNSPTRDNWVIRTDSAGVIIWQQEVAGSGYDCQIGNTLKSGDNGISLTTGGEVLIGNTSSSGISGNKTVASRGGMDYWIVGLDANTGAFNWQLGLGGSGEEELNSVFQTTDGGYFIAGYSASGISGDKTDVSRGSNDFWVIKTDAARNIEWQKTIGGSDEDQLMTALQTDDGWFLLAGYSMSGISGEKDEASRGDYDFWIVKLGPCDTTPTRLTVPICVGDTYTLPGGNTVSLAGVYHDTLRNVWNTCDSVVITTLQYYPGDHVHLINGNALGNDTTICADQRLELDIHYPGGAYEWSTGATTPVVLATASGDYWVKVTSPNGCEAFDTVSVTVHPMPDVDLGADTGVCDVYIPYILGSVQPAGSQYRWSTGLTTPQIEVSYSGRYALEVELNGCISRDSINIRVVPTPMVNIGRDSIICEQFPLRIGTEIAGAVYSWNTGAVTPYILVSSTDDYVLEVNIEGCIVKDTIGITAMPVPDIDLGDDGDICPEQTIVLDGTYQSGSRYLWNTGDTTANYAAIAAGTYIVTVTSGHGCIGGDTIVLTFYPKPTVSLGPDTVVCEETPLHLTAWTMNADSIRWSAGTIGYVLDIRSGGEYIATGINKCGETSDTIMVKQIFCEIWLPNAFTPNSDGMNDVFRILGNTGRLQGVTLSVYNRWGEQVFITQDRYQGWDGYHKGIPAQTGTYVYLLEYSLDGEPYNQTGNFHLLR